MQGSPEIHLLIFQALKSHELKT